MNAEYYTIDPEGTRLLGLDSAHGIMLDMARYAFDLAAKRDGEVAPIWQLVWPDTMRVGLVETPWQDDTEKAIYLGAIRQIIRADPPAHYSVMSEVWHIQRTKPRRPDDPLPAD